MYHREVECEKEIIFFVIGAILFITSLPTSTKMLMELIHNKKMNNQYDIVNVSKGDPATDSTYKFNHHVITIKETIKQTKSYKDPWDNQIKLADLSLELDGEQLDILKNHPIRAEEEGLNRYYGEVAYLIVREKENGKSQFVILLKKTRELQRKMPNGDIVGWAPEEKLKYTLYAIDEAGNVENRSFNFTEPDALQTELLNAGVVGPYRIGYYTNAWEGYPTIFFPLLFPFLTLIIGLILSITYLPSIKNLNRQSL